MIRTDQMSAADDERGERRRAARWDDCVLAALMIGSGGVRVGLALAAGESFGAEPSLAAVMLALGVAIAMGRRCP